MSTSPPTASLSRQDVREIVEDTLFSNNDKIKQIARQVFGDEQRTNEIWQFLKNEKYKEDIKRISEDFFRERKELILAESKSIADQTAKKVTKDTCKVQIPTILKTETTEYLKFLIQNDDRLGTAYRTYQSELQTIKQDYVQKVQMSADSCFVDFKQRTAEETKRILDEIVSRKCDDLFFVTFLEQLSTLNAKQVNKNLIQVQEAEKRCMNVALEHQQSMVQMKLHEQKKEEARKAEVSKVENELKWLQNQLWWQRMWCVGLSVASLFAILYKGQVLQLK